jgi:hypothetical protein
MNQQIDICNYCGEQFNKFEPTGRITRALWRHQKDRPDGPWCPKLYKIYEEKIQLEIRRKMLKSKEQDKLIEKLEKENRKLKEETAANKHKKVKRKIKTDDMDKYYDEFKNKIKFRHFN